MKRAFLIDPPHTLVDVVEHVLRRHPELRHRRLHVDVNENEVILRGQVGSYYAKQLAQEVIRGVVGEGRIANQLQVECGSLAG